MDGFRFKRFYIDHHLCPMKVGTDAVLLGAWASVPQEGKILDIGTGSGVVALMVAQRSAHAHVLGIDIDRASVEQATENASHSPFSDRVKMEWLDVLQMAEDVKYECILSNPPFFTEDTLPPDEARAAARNVCSLPPERLVEKVSCLLLPEGIFSVILPTSLMSRFVTSCVAAGMSLQKRLYVKTVSRKPPKRVLLTFVKGESRTTHDDTMVLMEDGGRSSAYTALTEDFYL